MTTKNIEKEIIIKVEGGCVVNVENMPKGYKYIIDDADLKGDSND
jgi:predicted TIM-barrel enzyme